MAKHHIVIPRQTKRLVNTLNRTEKIITWDFDNKYPQRISDLINASGVATRCVKRFKRFVAGRGFSDLATYKMVVDRDGGTMDKLLSLCAEDYAKQGGFAIHIRYNGLGQIVERRYMRFADTRLSSDDDKIAYYDNWDGTSLIKKFSVKDIIRNSPKRLNVRD